MNIFQVGHSELVFVVLIGLKGLIGEAHAVTNAELADSSNPTNTRECMFQSPCFAKRVFDVDRSGVSFDKRQARYSPTVLVTTLAAWKTGFW